MAFGIFSGNFSPPSRAKTFLFTWSHFTEAIGQLKWIIVTINDDGGSGIMSEHQELVKIITLNNFWHYNDVKEAKHVFSKNLPFCHISRILPFYTDSQIIVIHIMVWKELIGPTRKPKIQKSKKAKNQKRQKGKKLACQLDHSTSLDICEVRS